MLCMMPCDGHMVIIHLSKATEETATKSELVYKLWAFDDYEVATQVHGDIKNVPLWWGC